MKIKFITSISLIIYLPVVFVFSQYILNLHTAIKTNELELSGLEKIHKIIDIEMHLQRERGISMHTPINQTKLDAIYNTRSNIIKDLKALQNKELEREYTKLLETKSKLSNQQVFKRYTELITMCTKDIYQIVDQSKLIYENDRDTYNLLVLYAQDIPNIEEKMAKVRGFGSNILYHKELIDYNRGSIDVYLSNLENLSEILSIKFTRIHDLELNDIQSNILTSISQFSHYSKKLLSATDASTLDNHTFFTQATSYIDNLFRAQQDIYHQILHNLHERININNNQIINYSILFIVFNIMYIGLIRFFIHKMKQISYKETISNELRGLDTHLNDLTNESNLDIRTLCKTMMNHLSNNSYVSSVAVYLIDDDNKRLMLAETWGINQKEIVHFFEFGEGIIGEVSIQKKTKCLLSINEKNKKTIITSPLIYFNDLVGVIEIQMLTDEYDNYLLERKLSIFSKYLYRTRQLSKNKSFFELLDKEIIISKTDRFGLITYASTAFEKISGYSKNELIGKSHNIIRHPDMPKSLYENLWNTIQNGKIWQGEIKNIHKDGTEYWVNAIITPNFDFYGEVIGFTAIREHITDKKKIEELSIKDPMTNLYNRRGIISKLRYFYETQNDPLYIMLIDVDNFKLYNDHYGHNEGDKVLIAVANEIDQIALKNNGFAFRFGGEEFLLIFPAKSDFASIDVGRELVKKINSLGIEHQYNSHFKVVTVSAGLAELGTNDFEEIYKKADELLYKAKKEGRNQLCY